MTHRRCTMVTPCDSALSNSGRRGQRVQSQVWDHQVCSVCGLVCGSPKHVSSDDRRQSLEVRWHLLVSLCCVSPCTVVGTKIFPLLSLTMGESLTRITVESHFDMLFYSFPPKHPWMCSFSPGHSRLCTWTHSVRTDFRTGKNYLLTSNPLCTIWT